MSACELLFVPYSAWGHIAPMLAVATELSRRGVPVRVLAADRYRAAVESAGARLCGSSVDFVPRVPAGRVPADLIERGMLWRERRLAGVSWARTLETQLRSKRFAACVVDPHYGTGARVAARAGVPVIPFWTTYPSRWAGRRPGPANLHPLLWSSADRRPGGVAAVGPLLFDLPGRTIDSAVPTGGPLLVVSPGTVFERSVGFFRELISAFSGTSWTVVLATGHLPVAALGPLPDNIVAQRWIPQRELVGRADVLVTHAGMSSVHEAITAGTPMILAPRSREQRRTAKRLVELGLGALLDRPAATRRKAERLASNSAVQQRLRRIGHDMAWVDGPSRAADSVLSLSGLSASGGSVVWLDAAR